MSHQVQKITVIGQGYVGLPLAVAFGAHVPTVGFDVNEARIADLQVDHDRNGEVSEGALRGVKQLTFSADPAAIEGADF
jgi:UDP-N-acetyl-D-galactosamine dehydrogenase